MGPDAALLDARAQLAMSPSVLGRLDDNDDPEDFDLAPNKERKLGPLSADVDGFNVNAAVRIAADDDEGRERLARCCCKPVLSLLRYAGVLAPHSSWRQDWDVPPAPNTRCCRKGPPTTADDPFWNRSGWSHKVA